MDDQAILREINALVDEEHRLRAEVLAGTLTPDDERRRLREVDIRLDQLWDLLRRRQAARRRGEDPDAVQPRPADEVESYLQ
jgi:hypothetical protein